MELNIRNGKGDDRTQKGRKRGKNRGKSEARGNLLLNDAGGKIFLDQKKDLV